jgi:cell division transport system permease protein
MSVTNNISKNLERIVYINKQAISMSIRQLSLAPIATIVTFIVIGVVLALPMGMFVLIQNMQSIVKNVRQNTAQISIYLQPNLTKNDSEAVLSAVEKDPGIVGTQYISPEQGLLDFQNQIGTKDLLKILSDNPLPGVVIGTISPTITDQLQIQQLSDRIKQIHGVDKIRVDIMWLKRLISITDVFRHAFYFLMFLFGIGVILTTGNTIQLITEQHRHEIMVIKLIGGTDSFIRRPFLYSGLFYGFVGSIFSWLIVDGAVLFLGEPIQQLAYLYNTSFKIDFLGFLPTIYLLLTGLLLGYCGSWLATARCFREIEPN